MPEIGNTTAYPLRAPSAGDTLIGKRASTGATVSYDASGFLNDAGRQLVASAYRSAAASHGGTGWEKIPIDTVDFDSDGIFDTGTDRFVPSSAGYYLVSARTEVSTNAVVTGAIYKNGAVAYQLAASASTRSTTGTCLIYCNGDTDYLEFYAYCDTTPSLTVGQSATYMQVHGPLNLNGGNPGSMSLTRTGITVTNSDFETGDLTGWTATTAGGAVSVTGSNVDNGTSTYAAAASAGGFSVGSYVFSGSNSAYAEYYQDIDISDHTDAFEYILTATALKNFTDGANGDTTYITLELRNSGGTVLVFQRVGSTLTTTGTSMGLSINLAAHPDAVTARIILELDRNDGTYNNTAVDNIVLEKLAISGSVGMRELTKTEVVSLSAEASKAWSIPANCKRIDITAHLTQTGSTNYPAIVLGSGAADINFFDGNASTIQWLAANSSFIVANSYGGGNHSIRGTIHDPRDASVKSHGTGQSMSSDTNKKREFDGVATTARDDDTLTISVGAGTLTGDVHITYIVRE